MLYLSGRFGSTWVNLSTRRLRVGESVTHCLSACYGAPSGCLSRTRSAWKADALPIELHPQLSASHFQIGTYISTPTSNVVEARWASTTFYSHQARARRFFAEKTRGLRLEESVQKAECSGPPPDSSASAGSHIRRGQRACLLCPCQGTSCSMIFCTGMPL